MSLLARALLVGSLCACAANDNPDGTYACAVTQVRCGGGEAWPPGWNGMGIGTGVGGASTFTLVLSGATIAVDDLVLDPSTSTQPAPETAFQCTGTWEDGTTVEGASTGRTLACVLPAGTDCGGTPRTNVPFAVVTGGTNPNSGTMLATNQIWVGEWPMAVPTNLSAVCAKR